METGVDAAALLRLAQENVPRWAVLASTIAAIYVAGWKLFVRGRGPSTLAFISGAAILGVSTLTAGLVAGSLRGAAAGALGGAALFVGVLLHHQSANHALLGFTLAAALLGATLEWSPEALPESAKDPRALLDAALASPALSLFGFLGAVFGIGALASWQGIVYIFGRGTTLFSLLLCAGVGGVVYLDPTRASPLTGAALALLPFLLMKTQHPSYLAATGTSAFARVVQGVASVAAVAAPLVGALVASATGRPIARELAVTVPAASVVAVLLGAISRRAAVLGPFYHFERRATVFTAAAVALLAFEVASREAAAPSSPLSSTLLYTVVGYAAGAALLALIVVLLEPLQLYTAGATRAASVDLFALGGLFAGAAAILLGFSTRTAEIAAAAQAAWTEALRGPALAAQAAASLPGGPDAWPSPLLLALASAALFTLASLLHTALQRSSLLLAPFYSDATARGNPRLPVAALTFNVPTATERGASVDAAAVRAVLDRLAARNASGTFFLPGAAVRTPEGGALAADIVSRGHEVGLLGLAGPHSTAEVQEDIASAARAFEAALSRLPGPIHSRPLPGDAAPVPATGLDEPRVPEGGPANTLMSGATSYAGGPRVSTGALMLRPATLSELLSGGLEVAPPDLRQVRWYRPQDGSRDIRVLRAAGAAGLGVALWSACPFEWDGGKEDVAARLAAQLRVAQGLAHEAAMQAELARAVPRGEDPTPRAVALGVLHPGASRGAILSLCIGFPEYLLPPAAWGQTGASPVDAADAALDVLAEAGIGAAHLVPLSQLCPNRGATKDVLPVN